MSRELDFCPFCGEEVEWRKYSQTARRIARQNGQPLVQMIGCTNKECGAIFSFNTPIKSLAKSECRKAFNTRAVDGETSDGYHTFNELYHHRAVLFSKVVGFAGERAWKSKLHADGTMYDGFFIVGVQTPEGQATYHYAIDPYWEMFDCKEVEQAPVWDGHTPQEAIERIAALNALAERTCKNLYWYGDATRFWCSNCDFKSNWPISNGKSTKPNYCPNCGAKVVE